MAPSSFILITLLSLAMVSGIRGARTAPFGLDKDVTVEEAIKNLMHAAESTNSLSVENTRDCHTSNDNQNKGMVLVTDFEPRPSITAYPNANAKVARYQKMFNKDFEPRPSVSTYPDDATTFEKHNFDAKPTVNPEKAGTKKEFVKDFEPRPNISVYQG